MSEELKPCPACGGKGNPAVEDSDLGEAGVWWVVGCDVCDMVGPSGWSREEAVAAWNALPRYDWRPASEPPAVSSANDLLWALVTNGEWVEEAVYRISPRTGKGEWCELEGGQWAIADGVTHWMPKPPPPKP